MNKAKIAADLIEKLFKPEERRLASMITDLNKSNRQLTQAKFDGFIYNGKFYSPGSGTLTLAGPGQAKASLTFRLHSEMERWLKDRKIIEEDKAHIRQSLFKLIQPCQTEAEVRNALPECLISLVPGLSAHPRHDPAGYTLAGDERSVRQFQKCLPKMESYSAASLFY